MCVNRHFLQPLFLLGFADYTPVLSRCRELIVSPRQTQAAKGVSLSTRVREWFRRFAAPAQRVIARRRGSVGLSTALTHQSFDVLASHERPDMTLFESVHVRDLGYFGCGQVAAENQAVGDRVAHVGALTIKGMVANDGELVLHGELHTAFLRPVQKEARLLAG